MSSVRARMRRLALASVSVAVLAVACATASQSKVHTTPAGPEQRFSMVGSGFQTTALISKSGAQGPEVDVGRYDDGKTIRGKVDNRVIQMTITANRASGIWGSGPISVDVDEQGDQLKFTGLVAGR